MPVSWDRAADQSQHLAFTINMVVHRQNLIA
jgi:hypothetical protein